MPARVADAAVQARAPVNRRATLRQVPDPWLKELIGGKAEERGHAVEIGNLHPSVLVQDFVNPPLIVAAIFVEGLLIFMAGREQTPDIFAKNIEGFQVWTAFRHVRAKR